MVLEKGWKGEIIDLCLVVSFRSVPVKGKRIKLLKDKDLYDLRVGKDFLSGHKKHLKGQDHKEFFIKHEKVHT